MSTRPTLATEPARLHHEAPPLAVLDTRAGAAARFRDEVAEMGRLVPDARLEPSVVP